MSDYITVEGMQRLETKLVALTKERPIILEQVQTARAMGDLSENAEYHAAKEKQRNLDSELSNLSSRIAVLKVIDPASIPKDSIRFGAIVTIKEIHGKKTLHYHLVGPDEVYDTDDNLTRVSYVSPLGKAMLGKKRDEEFTVTTPKKNKDATPVELKYIVIDIK
jgi:transcription elongation factor GreA